MNEVDLPARDAAPNIGDYDTAVAGWKLEVPDRFNPVVDILETWADEDPEALALVSIDDQGHEGSSHTISELVDLAKKSAGALQELGVKAGDPVFVMLPRVAEWYAAVLGAIRIGAVPMPGPNLLTPKDIGFRIDQSGATVAITDIAGSAKFDQLGDQTTLRTRICWTDGNEAPAGWEDFTSLISAADGEGLPESPTGRDDALLLYFTSGTVSEPKMVRHTQEYGLGHVTTAKFWHDLRAGDRHWTVSDSGWAKAAYGGLFGQWHEHATVVQVQLTQPTPEMVLGIIRDHRITSFCAPPTLYRNLIQGKDDSLFDLPLLRHCTGAGEPLNPEVIRAWKNRTDLTIFDGYGQTEMVIVLANYPGMEVRPGSMGKAMPGWEVDVLGPDGDPAPDGEVGEVCVRTSPNRPIGLFTEYVGREEATAEVFSDDWYHTGDKAARDPDRYFWFEGRNDDVITSSAYRIGPFEVESALIEHPAVTEAAVVGRDDEKRTQIVCAFCILSDDHDASPELAKEIQDFVKESTAPYKYPREIHFVDELPKTVSGKIRRSELREELKAGKYPA